MKPGPNFARECAAAARQVAAVFLGMAAVACLLWAVVASL